MDVPELCFIKRKWSNEEERGKKKKEEERRRWGGGGTEQEGGEGEKLPICLSFSAL